MKAQLFISVLTFAISSATMGSEIEEIVCSGQKDDSYEEIYTHSSDTGASITLFHELIRRTESSETRGTTPYNIEACTLQNERLLENPLEVRCTLKDPVMPAMIYGAPYLIFRKNEDNDKYSFIRRMDVADPDLIKKGFPDSEMALASALECSFEY